MEGDIEAVDGVLRIAKIRLKYRFSCPAELRDKAERALAFYSEACPAYQTVKNCIEITWTAEMTDDEAK